jgi:hypothetical protein
VVVGRLASDCELGGFGGDDRGGKGYGEVTWELALGLRHGFYCSEFGDGV